MSTPAARTRTRVGNAAAGSGRREPAKPVAADLVAHEEELVSPLQSRGGGGDFAPVMQPRRRRRARGAGGGGGGDGGGGGGGGRRRRAAEEAASRQGRGAAMAAAKALSPASPKRFLRRLSTTSS
jgi:Predicted membrane protein